MATRVFADEELARLREFPDISRDGITVVLTEFRSYIAVTCSDLVLEVPVVIARKTTTVAGTAATVGSPLRPVRSLLCVLYRPGRMGISVVFSAITTETPKPQRREVEFVVRPRPEAGVSGLTMPGGL